MKQDQTLKDLIELLIFTTFTFSMLFVFSYIKEFDLQLVFRVAGIMGLFIDLFILLPSIIFRYKSNKSTL